MPRPIDDLGPDFDRRWRQAPVVRRREFIAELRDLYLMLEERDEPLLVRLRNGSIPPPRDDEPPLLVPEPATPRRQASLFDEATLEGALAAPVAAAPARENPFLPRSVLDRLQQNRRLAAAGLGHPLAVPMPMAPPVPASPADLQAPPLPASHEQSDLERELRLKLGPMVETLIEAQMEMIKSELRVRLRLEMDRLIAEHLRK